QEGVIAYGNALLAHQQQKKAIAVVGEAWQTMSLTKAQEKVFLSQFGSHLKNNHHVARLSHLIWNENLEEAKRQVDRVSGNDQKLAQIRIGFLGEHSSVIQRAHKLPAHLQTMEGFLYSQAKWFRKRKAFKDAYQILAKAPIGTQYAQKWWKEQN